MLKAKSALTRLFNELKRRHVFRVAIAYALVAWAVIQVVTQTFPFLRFPEWTVGFVIVLTMLGFPVAVTLAWAFEITPQGIHRAEQAPPAREDTGAATPAAVAAPGLRVAQLFPRTAPRRADHSGPAPRDSAVSAPPDPEPLPPDPGRERRASLATMRHELRTPLNAILGYSEMLMEEGDAPLPPELSARLQAVRERGKALLVRIDEVLKPTGTATDPSGSAEPYQLVREALDEPVRALQQDGQWLSAQCVAQAEAEWAVDVRHVSEAALRLATMMDELGRFSSSAPPTEGGSSLFGQARAVTERMFARIRPASGSADASPPRHAHLLVVDDNGLNRDLFSRQLTRQGFSVSTAASGREALGLLRTRNFDLVLLDVLMPELDGVQVLEIMQQDPILAEVPVIMISALDEIDGVVRCIEKGAADYLTKPFDPTLLQARIGSMLEIRRLREQQRHATDRAREMEAWSDRLMASLLPSTLAGQIAQGRPQPVEVYPEVTALAVELEGIDTIAIRGGPDQLRDALSGMYQRLDRVVADQPVERLWVGGRTLLVVAGAPAPRGDHAELIAELALRLADELAGGTTDALQVGMGVHTGSAVAGAIGSDRLLCGIWGEAVDIAHGLARGSASGQPLVSSASYARLYDGFSFESQGTVELGSHGQMRVYRLTGSRAASPA